MNEPTAPTPLVNILSQTVRPAAVSQTVELVAELIAEVGRWFVATVAGHPVTVAAVVAAGVAARAAGGVALMSGTGRAAHVPALLNAAGTCLVATAMAAVPLVMTRRSGQYAVAQAGLVSTMLHLFVTIGAAMFMLVLGRLSQPFLYWLIPLYFATLIPIVVAAVRAVRQAPPEPSPTSLPKP